MTNYALGYNKYYSFRFYLNRKNIYLHFIN